jgi:hypothetical protein
MEVSGQFHTVAGLFPKPTGQEAEQATDPVWTWLPWPSRPVGLVTILHEHWEGCIISRNPTIIPPFSIKDFVRYRRFQNSVEIMQLFLHQCGEQALYL